MKAKFTIAFDMEVELREDQKPEDVAQSYSYLIGLGKNWRIIKNDC